MKPLILGVGNILLSDEGVGVRVVQELEKRPEIQPHFDIIDGGTCGMELLDAMANREHLIIIDAVLANKQPGEIIVLHDEQVPTFFSRKISPHQLGICDVLSALKLTDEFPQNLSHPIHNQNYRLQSFWWLCASYQAVPKFFYRSRTT